MRFFLFLFLVVITGVVGCGKTYTQQGPVISPPSYSVPDYQYWDGSFSFRGSSSLYEDSSFEIRWRGRTPPPPFEIRIRSLGDKIHFFSPYLEIYIKYSDYHYGNYEYSWYCYPQNWVEDNNYLVTILVDGYEVRSEDFRYRG